MNKRVILNAESKEALQKWASGELKTENPRIVDEFESQKTTKKKALVLIRGLRLIGTVGGKSGTLASEEQMARGVYELLYNYERDFRDGIPFGTWYSKIKNTAHSAPSDKSGQLLLQFDKGAGPKKNYDPETNTFSPTEVIAQKRPDNPNHGDDHVPALDDRPEMNQILGIVKDLRRYQAENYKALSDRLDMLESQVKGITNFITKLNAWFHAYKEDDNETGTDSKN